MENESKAIKLFNIIGGIVLFLFGLGIETKNIFFVSQPNGYELLFGIEFISTGIWLFYGKFKGFKNINNESATTESHPPGSK